MIVYNYKTILDRAELLNNESKRLLSTGMEKQGFLLLLKVQELLLPLQAVYRDRNN